MRLNLHLLLGFAALLLSSTEGLSQPGGQGGPPGTPGQRGGFPGGGFGDPMQFFNQMSGGKDVWLRTETDPRNQRRFDMIAAQLGITNGQITRQQYLAYQDQRAAQRQQGGMSPNGGGRGGNAPLTAESMFAFLDKNGDGLLNFDEMPDQLRSERDRWDTDRNGFIDLKEFKAFFEARIQPPQTQTQSNSPGADPQLQGGLYWDFSQGPTEEDLRKPPVVYRPGKLPKELPAWFEQYDTDKDGQIGLYEWKAFGKSVQEFDEIDRNKDGFLTVDEVLRFVNKNNGTSPGNGGPSPGMQLGYAGNGNFPGNGGDFNGRNFNRGGGPGGRPDRGPGGGRGGRGPRGGRGGPGGGPGGNGRGGPDYNYNSYYNNYND